MKAITDDFLEDKMSFNGNRYVVKLPWLTGDTNIDSNYTGALHQVKTSTKKLICTER